MGYLSGYDDDMGTVLAHVRAERFRQEDLRKSGKFSHTCATPGANNDKCNTILGEEVGEAAKALNDGDIPGLRTELVQVAAVAVAWVERLDAEALAARQAAQKPKQTLTPAAAARLDDILVAHAEARLHRNAGEAVPLATSGEVEALRAEYTGLLVFDDPDASKEVIDPAERAKIAEAWQMKIPGQVSFRPGILAEAAEHHATPERYAALGDSYDFIERMIEERTKANPQFPEMLAAAEARRKEIFEPMPRTTSAILLTDEHLRRIQRCPPERKDEVVKSVLAEAVKITHAETRREEGKAAPLVHQVEGLEPVAPSPRSHRATAFADVAAERERQVTVKGYSEEHDDSHGNGSIAAAAISFTAAALGDQRLAENMYPFGLGFVAKATDSTRKLLVKAAALLIAEIERQDRAAEDRGANAADMADGESSSADTGDGES